jgi:hypothetical protein
MYPEIINKMYKKLSNILGKILSIVHEKNHIKNFSGKIIITI